MRVGVVVRTKDNLWSVARFADEEAVEKYIAGVEKELADQVKDINIVQLDPTSPILPPEDYKPTLEDLKLGKYWCPWCGDFRPFVNTEDYPDDLCCNICHISDSDYYIRRYNQLDYFDSLTKRGDKKKRSKKNGNN